MMAYEQDTKEWRELTFAQREGMAPLPEPLQAGVLSKKFRNGVWFAVEKCIESNIYLVLVSLELRETTDGKFFMKFPHGYFYDVLNITHDEVEKMKVYDMKKWLRNLIFESESHELITLIEYMLRCSYISKSLSDKIKNCFDDAPYLIDDSSEPICIISVTSEEMKESVARSLDNINKSELIGSKSHLNNAAQALSNNDFPASMRESIHAVEAAARQIDPAASKNINAALDSLQKKGMLTHPALKDGFKKLYAYTSDEKGIRHSLGDQKVANVGFDEAIFMYGACVSFIDYLVSKHKQASEK